MTVPSKLRLKNTIKYPTTIIVGGLTNLGLEIADSLMKQGGYVVIVDTVTPENVDRFEHFDDRAMISFLDYTAIPHLEEDIRRVDYVFYFAHESIDFRSMVSTQEFLTFSNYLDATLSLTAKFEARFLLTTSIKAQQILFSEKQFGYDASMIDRPQQTYTDMEIQRYAEGLTLEYFEKIGLNAKVLRLGEIIGEGMDFSAKTAFRDLLFNAVNEQNLLLRNDGLENEWFVHFFDCTYALIKAQFSKGTAGKVYSVAFENTYTHLSIAYKIQEVDEEIKEIQFIESNENTPPIKIHKPAPNLTTIGWMPRVSFDKAIRQSLAAAKIYLMEKGIENVANYDEVADDDNLSGKIRNLFMFAESAPDSKAKSLIDRKKEEEERRKERILNASEHLKNKRKKRNKTFFQRLQNSFWGGFVKLASVFTFFRRKSPAEVGLIIFSIILFAFIYFTLISPALVISRNSLVVASEKNKLEKNLENYKFNEVNKNASNLNSSLIEIRDILEKYDSYFNILTLDDEYEILNNEIEEYITLTDGIKDTTYALTPFSEYVERYELNTQLRNNQTSYISILDQGSDYSEILNRITERKAFLDTGLEKIDTYYRNQDSENLSKLPGILGSKLRSVNNKLLTEESNLKSLYNYLYLAELLGSDEPKTYVFNIVDNSRLQAIGGELSAYSLITMNNGSIQEIFVQNTDNIDIPDELITEEILSEINATRFTTILRSDVNYSDLSTMSDYEQYSEITKNIFENQFNRDVDSVITVNLDSFNNIITELDVFENSEIGGANFAGGDFISNLNSAQIGNSNLLTKRELIAQVFANLFQSIITNTKNRPSFINSITNQTNNQNILIDASGLDYQQVVKDNNLNLERIYDAQNYIKAGINITDDRVVDVARIPDINLSLESTVGSDFIVDNRLTITFPNIGSTQEVFVCVPDNVLINSIIVDPETINPNRTAINRGDKNTCIVAQAINETQLQLSWSTDTLVSPDTESANIKFAVAKINGANTNLDYSLQLASGLTLNNVDLPIETSGNSFAIAEKLQKDLFFEIEVSR